MNEFVIEWVKGQTIAAITAPASTALANKIIKLSKSYPDECDYNINSDGSVFGHVPVKYIKVSHPKVVTEEQRAQASARLKAMWEKNEQKDVDCIEVEDFID